ncbi:SRPBCC domain-containing protein [Halomicroarcula sp. GCM10025709]|uniref:SRPBCC domain-containing protein n=1 Tax=Haloarcula TaxID=2237 RepID=UPI0024C31219|nr:SRPBCC domain-containing protein [Halomicroarcula sp. YJ-61-S]
MRELSASVDIPVPPETVWNVLTDVEAYPRWNTLLRIEGELAPGATVDARLSVPGLPTVSFSPEILAVDPGRELRWRSGLLGVTAEHAFLLEPLDGGTGTRFTQYEEISGPLTARVVDRLARRLRRGFEQMNVGLRRHAIAVADT